MSMKKYILTFVLLLTTAMLVEAQDKKKFSPEKFEADMEEFITQQAGLTQQEAAKVFPLIREMHSKQRAIYGKVHKLAKNKPADDAGCIAVINDYDRMNIELKRIEKCYHKKMMQEVSASKVYDIIKAEYRFHRGWMTGAKPRGKRR